MDNTYIVPLFISLILSQSIFGYPSDPMISPFEARNTISYLGPFNPYQYEAMSRSTSPQYQHQLHHQSPGKTLQDHRDAQNFTLTDLLATINEVSHKENEPEHFKAVVRDYDFLPYPGTYTSPKPGYTPQGYHEPAYKPPAHSSPAKFALLKPDLAGVFAQPVTKVANKISGLLSLVLMLLTGSASGDVEMKGFIDIVINGILKPLLIVKGGIKSLISKLAIPVISLLLINLEVLITIWWMWDECPVQKPADNYTKPEYNSYSYQ